jgi:4-hydroxy-2-oxoheptanedioate aldolase
MRAADATGVTPVVRVPSHNPSDIMRVLDAGAAGVLVPNVNTAAEARAIVAAAKYKTPTTDGKRGACPRIRAAGHQVKDWATFADWSNQNTMVWLLIESPEAAARLDEILQVPGIDAIMLGPFDLSVVMGYPGNTTHPAVQKKLEEITATARKRGVDVVAVLLSKGREEMLAEQKRWVELGCRLVNVVSDRRLIAVALAEAMQRSKR